jgi:hypothetical protein
MITTYAELQAAVANWMHRTDLTAKIPDFITFAENKIYRDLRVRCMEEPLSGTIANEVLAVPASYLELKHAYVDTATKRPLARKTPEWIYKNYPATSGVPLFIATEGDSFIFGPTPDSAYTIKGIYFKRLPALSDSNTTNWFLTNAADLVLSASLAEAAEYARDINALAYWSGKYETLRAVVQRENDMEAFSGSQLFTTAG